MCTYVFFFQITCEYQINMWRIHNFEANKYENKRPDLLPCGTFTLCCRKQKIKASGFLPTHHSDVEFELLLSKPNNKQIHQILGIVHIKCNKKKKQKYKQFSNKLPKQKQQQYIDMAEHARTSIALWTLSTVYTYYTLPTDIAGTFNRFVNDFTEICRRGAPDNIRALIYDYEKSVVTINRGLVQMGELPKAREWVKLKELHKWQCQTRYSCASSLKPSLPFVENYKGKWVEKHDLKIHQALVQHFRPDNTALIQGSPAPSTIPSDAIVIVRNAEDAYKWKMCILNTQQIYTHKIWFEKTAALRGLLDLKLMPDNQEHVFIAYAHLWGQEDWQRLLHANHKSYTLIGRLDQFPSGRGQLFRDMCESNKFDIQLTHHRGAEVVEMTTKDCIDQIVDTYNVVQCFYDGSVPLNIDTNRRYLSKPWRIRTLKRNSDDSSLLHEEETMTGIGKNASVVHVRNFSSIPVNAGIFICSEESKSFDIHVARTHCLHALYIIGDTPSMFALQRKPPARNSIPW